MYTKQQALEDAHMGDNVYSIYQFRQWSLYAQRRKQYDDVGNKITGKGLMTDRERVAKIQSEKSYKPS